MGTPIYNCHIHTFTAEHVLPDIFLSRLLVRAMRKPWLRKLLIWLVGGLLRMNKDSLRLTGRFLARGSFESQEYSFNHIYNQYPENARFIVLPMDFEFMGISKRPIRPYEDQLKELANLRDKNEQNLIPFCAVDPRRPNVVEEFKRWHREYKIKGVKIYPNLGYYPHDPVLMEVYEYCEKKKLPVLAHCSPGGIRKSGLSLEKAREFAHPENYIKILEQFPKLNFCLAHFGGSEEWERHLTGEVPRTGGDPTWITVIAGMIRSEKYPNLFTDVSYTLFVEMPSYRPFNYFNFLNVLLEDKCISEHVLFGTDYYMVEREKVSEKEVSIGLRAHLGEKLYFQIAYDNPRKYLYETKNIKKQPQKTRGKTVRK